MAEEDTAESDSTETGLIAKLKSNKKLMIGVALLFIILIGGAAYYFILVDKPKEEVVDLEKKDESVEEDAVKQTFEKVNKYFLKTFFFPIELNNSEESGHFLLVTPIFIISNAGLSGQISKDLSSIRKTIYNIFLQQKHENLTTNLEITKERVKKIIITKVNEILPVGTGVVKEVYFSQFIVK
jgi:flagellar basal body-associated protein FliL